jgi:hypothetical protein
MTNLATISDLPGKIEFLKNHLKWGTFRKIAELVVGDTSDSNAVKAIENCITKWSCGKATLNGSQGRKFVSFLEDVLDPEGYRLFMDASENQLQRYLESPGRSGVISFDVFESCPAGNVDSIKNHIVDHRFNWTNKDSIQLWIDVADSELYEQYRNCLSTIEAMFLAPNIITALSEPAEIFMLGCGTPLKDLLLIERFEKIKRYTLIDFSYEMLLHTTRFIRNQRTVRMLTLEQKNADFCQLESEKQLSLGNFPAFWFIPGGTFGNLDEDKFLRSMNHQCRPGDKLLIGVDTIDDHSDVGFVDQYKNDKMHAFVRPALALAAKAYDPQGSRALSQYKVDAEPVDGFASGLSKVPGSLTARVWTEINGISVTLLHSTRYQQVPLEAFLSSYGFKKISAISCPKPASKYRFLIFERI